MRTIWRFLVGLFAVFGLLAVLLFLGVAGAVYAAFGGFAGPVLPERVVLRLDLGRPLRDGPPDQPLTAALTGSTLSLHEAVEAVDRAAADPRVVGLVGDFGGEAFGLATAQELRDAVERFRAAGKFTLAYADTFGELGPGNTAYYLAAGFERILIQPMGMVGLTGVRAEVPFAREVLSDIGVEPQFTRRGAYKSFPESFTERDFTPAHREMVEGLVGDLYAQLVAGIAEGRGLAPAEVERLIDQGPLLAEEAQAAGLVDAFADRRQVEDEAEAEAGEDAELLDLRAYLAAAGPAAAEPAARVALIYADGAITTGESSDELLGGRVMGATTVAEAIDEALEDDDVDAIVLRIDSGGGSAVASEVIGRAVRRARDEGTPLIASMGEAAASGGYWIAAGAAEIVAQPATLTGSIGVFAGKPVLEEFWDDVGINWEAVERGANAGMFSPNQPFTPAQAARLDALTDAIYERFLTLVAESRGLDREAVRAVAEGRVWTGAQAQERGLVDRLGGLDAALAAAREALGLDPAAALDIVILPEPETALEEIAGLLGGVPVAGRVAADLRRDLAAVAAPFAPLLEPSDRQLLRMPELVLGR